MDGLQFLARGTKLTNYSVIPNEIVNNSLHFFLKDV